MGRKPTTRERGGGLHPYVLYTAAVQNVDSDLDFARGAYRRANGRAARRLREDFCGTACLACAWARGRPDREAWGVDLDAGALAWGEAQHRAPLGRAAARVHLLRGDVLTARTPPVDIVIALNFSYCVFKERALLRRYLRRAHAALAPGGILVMDVFGGTNAQKATKEHRMIRGGRGPDGRPLPAFRYHWEHSHFNAATHDLRCHIHFDLPNGRRLRRAFTYDWRLWTIPELRELLAEAGFASSEVHSHGWTRTGDSDHTYRHVQHIENELGWLAYVVGRRRK